MPRLSDQDRAIAIDVLEAHTPVKQVARRMGVSPNAIRKLRLKFQQTDEVIGSQQRFTRRINSMRRRCQAVIDRRGGYALLTLRLNFL